MAFRIHDSVVRGEIDNRVKATVSGRIGLEGRAEPLTLELHGNAQPDLAGCLLTFVNPLAPVRHPQMDSLTSLQRGEPATSRRHAKSAYRLIWLIAPTSFTKAKTNPRRLWPIPSISNGLAKPMDES
jgi:hypothetical protein